MPVLGILDGIVQTFELATQTWFSTLFPIAQNLFFALMVIQIAWAGIWSTLVRHESGEQVLVHLLRQVFVLSILYTVLIFSPIWVPTVIGSFEQADGPLETAWGKAASVVREEAGRYQQRHEELGRAVFGRFASFAASAS